MAKLTREQIVTIEVLQQRGQSQSQTARVLGVSEGAVRYHLRRARDGATDRRRKPSRIEQRGLAEVVAHWWQAQVENLGHSNLHYGNMIVYLRLLGIVPASSRGG